MVKRKRTTAAATATQPDTDKHDDDGAVAKNAPAVAGGPEQHGVLHRIRNMWEFAALVQYIYSFGKYMKVPEEVDIDFLETECLKPGYTPKLLDLGLTFLKFVSSHRGLTEENFDEYTRRQYYAKAPSRNPFGDDEEPLKFMNLDVFTKIRILHQLTMWTLWNPDRFRAQMPEQTEREQTSWRIEEFGYDEDDRYYYVLDDNRLYRRTNPPIPAPEQKKPKANSKRGRALARAAKKRKLEQGSSEATDGASEGADSLDLDQGFKWECLAITLEQYKTFVDGLAKTEDPDEKILRDRLIEHVIPIIEKQEEAQQRKIRQREKELANLERLATAKRSSRIAEKHERERVEAEKEGERRKHEAERREEQRQVELQKKAEKERRQQLLTREQRVKEREEKKRQRQEEIARRAEEAKLLESGEKRMSERRREAELERQRKEIEALKEQNSWVFDCSGCGAHGRNLDDGTHTILCEKCDVWQHSACLGISKEEAEKEDFNFVCGDCKRREEEAARPKIPPLKFRVGPSASPPTEKTKLEADHTPKQRRDAKAPTPVATGQPVANAPHAGRPEQQTVPPQPYPQRMPPAPNGAPHPASNPLFRPAPQQQPMYPGAPAGNQPQTYAAAAPYGRPPYPQQMPAPYQPYQPPPPPPPAYPQTRFIHHYAPSPHPQPPDSNRSYSRRPSSSHSTMACLPSPIQNRPSISPTQGNRDVGPLAGFPGSNNIPSNVSTTPTQYYSNPPSAQTGVPSSTRAQPSYTPLSLSGTGNGAPFPFSSPASTPARRPSSQAQTPQGQNQSQYHPHPHPHSQGQAQTQPPFHPNQFSPAPIAPLSGISPTKPSPQPHASAPPFPPNTGNATILPPIQRLEPSPKLMGRSSPDEPIPAPTKTGYGARPVGQQQQQQQQGNGPVSLSNMAQAPPHPQAGAGVPATYPSEAPSAPAPAAAVQPRFPPSSPSKNGGGRLSPPHLPRPRGNGALAQAQGSPQKPEGSAE